MSEAPPQKLYPELPWTDEDEVAADRALAKQIAAGDTGSHLTAEEAEAMDAQLRREIAEVKRAHLEAEAGDEGEGEPAP